MTGMGRQMLLVKEEVLQGPESGKSLPQLCERIEAWQEMSLKGWQDQGRAS